MTISCPPLVKKLVIAEDPHLAAQISCALALPGHYLPVVEGPRFLHTDPAVELVRRHNAAGRVRPELIFMTGLSDKAFDALTAGFVPRLKPAIRRVSTAEEIERLGDPERFNKPPLTWGKDRIGIGLLKALRGQRCMFKYPDLGIAMINGFAAEQPDQSGIGFVALVDPETTEAGEIAATERLLPPRGAFVRTYRGPGANVRDVTTMMELLPYDLMIIATHCGDVDGFRWTYEYTDSERIDRKLVVDIAIGVGQTDDANMLSVTQFIRFISLDGVDWHDQEKKNSLYIGRAIIDYIERTRPPGPSLEPVKKETVPRVIGSSALKMHDHNLIVLPRALADEGTPIIINNACASWHRLASNLFVGGVRAYVGTLFPVTTSEAQDVIIKLLDKHIGKPLPAALWSAQRAVYNDDLRRPYVAAGIFPQRLRIKSQDMIGRMVSRLSGTLSGWQKTLAGLDPNDREKMKTVRENISYYERELAHFRRLAQKAMR
jgi:hypothetical protein